ARDLDGSLLVTNLPDATLTIFGNIVRVDPATGAQTADYSGGSLFAPGQPVVAPNGDLFVPDSPGGVGKVTRIAANAARNIISGSGSTGNVVEGNWIGTDASGAAALGNHFYGVYVNTAGNTIGGLTATPGTGAGNVISGNSDGIRIETSGATGNLVQGNII